MTTYPPEGEPVHCPAPECRGRWLANVHSAAERARKLAEHDHDVHGGPKPTQSGGAA